MHFDDTSIDRSFDLRKTLLSSMTAIGKTGVSREAILPSVLQGFVLQTPNTDRKM